MRILNFLVLLFLVLVQPCSLNAQSAETVDEDLYHMLKHNYAVSSYGSDNPILSFFEATNRTFTLTNDTTLQIFRQKQHARPELEDSVVIGQMTAPVINRFLDSVYQTSLCPVGYEQSTGMVQAYSDYMCSCIPEEVANTARYDSASLIADAIASCKRVIRFNDSLKTHLTGSLPSMFTDRCIDAFVFTHCLHLRTTITELCSRIVLEQYRLDKLSSLNRLAMGLEYCLRKGKNQVMPRKMFDHDAAYAQMDAAAWWSAPELAGFYRDRIFCYTEVRDYGHGLVMTFLNGEGKQPVFWVQVQLTIRWEGGQYFINHVELVKPSQIIEKEKLVQGAREMRRKAIASMVR